MTKMSNSPFMSMGEKSLNKSGRKRGGSVIKINKTQQDWYSACEKYLNLNDKQHTHASFLRRNLSGPKLCRFDL